MADEPQIQLESRMLIDVIPAVAQRRRAGFDQYREVESVAYPVG